jgi:hypothetical protein
VFELFVWVILACFATEAVVEIITKSELFVPIISKLALREDFFSKLVTCPYCLSVWVAGFFTLIIYLILNIHLFFIPILIFSIHGISNKIHDIGDKINIGKRKRSVRKHKKNNN